MNGMTVNLSSTILKGMESFVNDNLLNYRDGKACFSESQEKQGNKLHIEEENFYKSGTFEEEDQNENAMDIISNKSSEKKETGVNDEIGSNFDSPYDGDDKFCLDILGTKKSKKFLNVDR